MPLTPLPQQDPETPWPLESWPTGSLPRNADSTRIDAYFDRVFAQEEDPEWGKTFALALFIKGRLIREQYAPGYGPEQTLKSWSMAKSITNALVGIMVKDGLLDIHAPAEVPEWQEDPNDPRRHITLDHLLRMVSGLQWTEVYSPDEPSNVVEMLYGNGKLDMGAYAAAMPLEWPVGAKHKYSSGTTNIICRLIKQVLGVDQAGMLKFMRDRLFDPIGMTSATPKFDSTGTFIGSSFCFCTVSDFARFGHLCLRDGVWDGNRILPEGWLDYTRTPTPIEDTPGWDYGAHFYLRKDDRGSFNMSGHEGQFIVMDPSTDTIIVRLGLSKSGVQSPEVRISLWDHLVTSIS